MGQQEQSPQEGYTQGEDTTLEPRHAGEVETEPILLAAEVLSLVSDFL